MAEGALVAPLRRLEKRSSQGDFLREGLPRAYPNPLSEIEFDRSVARCKDAAPD